MLELLKNLFEENFIPHTHTHQGQFMPHGYCYLWKPSLVWLHVVSDSLIALAYYSILVMLVYFVQKRRDVPFDWIFLMFGAFIVACGTTHIMEVWTLWHANYWLTGGLKAITAAISLWTAVRLVGLIPMALTLRSPGELEESNRKLEKEIGDRLRFEVALQDSEAELRALFAAMTDAIFVFDASGRYLKIAQTNPNLLYKPPASLVGRTLEDVFAKEQADLFLSSIRQALDTGQPVNLEYKMDIFFEERWFLACLSRLTFDSVIWVARDITAPKQTEEALRQANQEMQNFASSLEKRVEERTAELEKANALLSQEIRERNIAQEALQEALQYTKRQSSLLSTVINATPDWIFIKDSNFRYFLVNQSYADALGQNPPRCDRDG